MTMIEKPIDRILRSTLGLILLAIVLFLLASPTALIEGMILLVVGIPGVLLLSTGVCTENSNPPVLMVKSADDGL